MLKDYEVVRTKEVRLAYGGPSAGNCMQSSLVQCKMATLLRSAVTCVLLCASSAYLVAQPFPEVRTAGGVSEYSAWLEAPIVVSGSLKGVRAYGAQERTVRSAGLGPHIGVLYWCTAALTIQHVLKGPSALRGITRDYVWADIEPGCRSGRRAIARQNRELSIWFVRRDGLLLRPQNDFGMPTHFSIRTPDSGRKAAMTPTGLGLALLTPTSYAGGAKEMGDSSLYTIAAMACSLLGKEACIGHLQQLVIRHPPLRGMTCAYLNEVYGMSCP